MFNIQQSYVLPTVFACFLWFPEQTAFISLYSSNLFVCPCNADANRFSARYELTLQILFKLTRGYKELNYAMNATFDVIRRYIHLPDSNMAVVTYYCSTSP
jgi:hypothetical protein